jgi:hypothetical protein
MVTHFITTPLLVIFKLHIQNLLIFRVFSSNGLYFAPLMRELLHQAIHGLFERWYFLGHLLFLSILAICQPVLHFLLFARCRNVPVLVRSGTDNPGGLSQLSNVCIFYELFSCICMTCDSRERSLPFWLRLSDFGAQHSHFFVFDLYTHLILNINS